MVLLGLSSLCLVFLYTARLNHYVGREPTPVIAESGPVVPYLQHAAEKQMGGFVAATRLLWSLLHCQLKW